MRAAAAAQALSLRCSWCGAQAAWAGRRVSSARGSGGDGGCCADADVDPLGGAGSGTGEPLALPPGNPLSSVRQPATCAAVQKAAELLSGLARMIDTFVPQVGLPVRAATLQVQVCVGWVLTQVCWVHMRSDLLMMVRPAGPAVVLSNDVLK